MRMVKVDIQLTTGDPTNWGHWSITIQIFISTRWNLKRLQEWEIRSAYQSTGIVSGHWAFLSLWRSVEKHGLQWGIYFVVSRSAPLFALIFCLKVVSIAFAATVQKLFALSCIINCWSKTLEWRPRDMDQSLYSSCLVQNLFRYSEIANRPHR